MNRPTLLLALISFLPAQDLLHAQEAVHRVTQTEALKAATSKPQPDYPVVARQLKIEGRVDVEVGISATGAVDEVRILSGNPALTGAAVTAVKHWRFDPFTSEGKAVPTVAVLSFSFHH